MGVLPDLLVFIPNSFILGDRPEITDDGTATDGMHGSVPNHPAGQ